MTPVGKDDESNKHQNKDADKQERDGQTTINPDTVREPKPNPHSDE
jgi:hypothetical protein